MKMKLFCVACILLGFAFKVGVADPENGRLGIEEARSRARLLESAYISTLQHMHRRYFDGNERAAVPSSVMEDIFRRVDYDHGTKSRWISVNTPAMDPAHEPKDPLSKEIAKFLKANNSRFERISDDSFLSARAITLFASCQKCHVSVLSQQTGGRKVAGLVIEIPLVSRDKD